MLQAIHDSDYFSFQQRSRKFPAFCRNFDIKIYVLSLFVVNYYILFLVFHKYDVGMFKIIKK